MTPRNQAAAVIACTLWATAFVGVKYGLGFMSAFTFAGIRFILAGAMQVPFCRRPAQPFRLMLRSSTLWVALFNTALLYAGFFKGLELVRGAQAAIIIGASPLISAIMAHFLMPNDRMSLSKLRAIAIGIVGIVIIALTSKPWEPVGRSEFLGMMILFGCSIVATFGNILVAKAKQDSPPVPLNSAQMMIGGAVLLAIGLGFEGVPALNLPWQFWATLVYLAFLSAAAFAIWFTLLQTEKVSRLNVWKFLIPVLGAVFSWALLPGESPDAITVGGMALVAVAVVLNARASAG